MTVESAQVDRHDGTGENKAGTQGEAERSHAGAKPLNHSQPATSWTVPSTEDFQQKVPFFRAVVRGTTLSRGHRRATTPPSSFANKQTLATSP